MIVHLSAVKAEFIGKTSKNQRRFVATALEAWQRAVRSSGEVRIKSYARNQTTISVPQQQAPVKRVVGASPVDSYYVSLPGDLVYIAKVQHSGEVKLKPAVRSRSPKMTGYAKGVVRDGCQILKGIFGTDCYFFTATLPGSTPAALKAIADNSAGILNAFEQRVRHHLRTSSLVDDRDDGKNNSVGVWEWQKRGALHLHWVIGIKNPELAEEVGALCQTWWRNVLLTYSKKTGVDLFGRLNGKSWKDAPNLPKCEWEKVKFDVGRYMSKYISKGNSEEGIKKGALPSRWSSVSKPVKQLVVAARNANALRLLTKIDAEDIAAEFAALAQELGGEVHEMRNPITNAFCGYTIFWNNDNKNYWFDLCNDGIETLKREPDAVHSRGAPWLLREVGKYPLIEAAELIFEGRTLDADEALGAGLCAPFSAPEKGGGMR